MVLPSGADTFTLKDGTVFDGAILSEAADSYTVEVQVTKSIKDERVIPKTDVQKLDRVKPDIVAFAAIEKLVPTPNFVTQETYLPKIAAVNKFLQQFPASSKSRDAKAVLSTLKAEFDVIAAGGLKLEGRLISAADYRANAYELDSRMMEAKIRRLVEANELFPALRAFYEFDRDYQTTLSYGTLAPAMAPVIKRYLADTRASLATLDERVKARQVGLEQMSPVDRAETAAAIKEEDDAIEARYASENASKQGWPTVTPYHKASHDTTITFGEQELVRLAAVKTVLGVDGGRIFREAYKATHNGANAVTVTAALTAAKNAKIPARYLDSLGAGSMASPSK